MLDVEDAQRIVRDHARMLTPRPMPLSPGALGCVLAEDIASDIDMPPFDKAMMDGFAVRSAEIGPEPREFEVIEEITAGRTPTKVVGAGQVTRIMTGAPMPAGADSVVMVEKSQPVGPTRVLLSGSIRCGANVQPKARELRSGEIVLQSGAMLRSQEIGLLAIVGRESVLVHPMPSVAVLATGDELVEPRRRPGSGQIRNSNGPMLLAQVVSERTTPTDLGIARDNPQSLRESIAAGLEHDVLLLSGGVSAGKLDLVPDILAELGVEAHFHKIRMKPGKPLFFGTRGSTLVFGLPGNPVSSFVCFELFVRPALEWIRGVSTARSAFVSLPLAVELQYATDRPTYHPARVESVNGCECVRPTPWHGSPDLRALTAANALMRIPPGESSFAVGQGMPVLLLRET